jgi:hypothetical protein
MLRSALDLVHANPDLSTQAFQASGRWVQELEWGVPSPCLLRGNARRCLDRALRLRVEEELDDEARCADGVAGWQ